MLVKDKKIIVTGAGSGIGRELTLQLINKGAFVAALDINEKELNITKEMANNSERLSLFVVDISSDESLNKFKEDYYKKHSEVDGLINNAGIIQPFINVEKLDMDTIYRVMNVNFYGPLKLTKLFLPELMQRKEAHITNVSSMGGFFPFPGQTVYGASKAAIKLFTEGLYAELLNTNVGVTIIFPGAIATNIMKNSNVKMEVSESSSKMKMLSAQDAASQIIDATEKNKFKVYVGSDSKFMNFLYKFNDKFAIKYIVKMMSKIK
ncbi:MAG TPA: SDR family oxidoreductase [Bacilli bacterium]|nr:SDR family oxidoreductase [Bacilli bacterium]